MFAFARRLAAFTTVALLAPSWQAAAADALHMIEGSPPTISIIEYNVAQEAGFFKQQDLDMAIDFADNGATATQLVASGQGDIGNVAMEAYLRGFDQGMRGKFIASHGNVNIFFMAVAKDSPIRSASDLKGKKIGVGSMGSLAIPYVQSFFRNAGLDYSHDALLPVGFGDTALAALQSGQVDALALNRSTYADLSRGGYQFRYIFHPKLAHVGNEGYFVSESALNDKRPSLIRFLRAMIMSDIFIQANPEAALRIFWKDNPSFRPAEIDAKAYQVGKSQLSFKPDSSFPDERSRVTVPDTKGLSELVSVMHAEGVVQGDITVDDLADDTLYKEASKGVDRAAVEALAKGWKD